MGSMLCYAKSLQLCPTLCDPIDGSPPGSPVPGISRQEHWSGLPFPSPEDLPKSGIKLKSLMAPALAGGFFTTSTTWEAIEGVCKYYPRKLCHVLAVFIKES